LLYAERFLRETRFFSWEMAGSVAMTSVFVVFSLQIFFYSLRRLLRKPWSWLSKFLCVTSLGCWGRVVGIVDSGMNSESLVSIEGPWIAAQNVNNIPGHIFFESQMSVTTQKGIGCLVLFPLGVGRSACR
jgi:hypothetical protein